MGSNMELPDVKNKFEDLSGVNIPRGTNPYNALIEMCDNDPAQIQALYAAHRINRNLQQREKFVSPDFRDLIIDPYLLRLEDPSIEPGFKDPRYCMTFWGRPPTHVLELAGHIQKKVLDYTPKLWLMPLHRMHITTLEIAFCRTAQEISSIQSALRPLMPTIASYTHQHRARLVKPMISYDRAALALSFLPACGEPAMSPKPIIPDTVSQSVEELGDFYSYHHLRRDLWKLVKNSGSVEIESRYIVPSAHITLGRFLEQGDHDTPQKRQKWVQVIDEINEWLEREVWTNNSKQLIGEWVVGQEKGLDIRVGPLWYGGGRTIMMGEGF